MTEHTFDPRLSGHSPDAQMQAVVDLSATADSVRLSRLVALQTVDSTGVYARDGFTSPSALLVGRCGMGVRQADREVFLSRALEDLPYAAKLAAAGRLSTNQLEVLAHAQRRHPEQYAVDEPNLAESVAGLDLRDTRRAVDYWSQAHDEPGNLEPKPSRLHHSKTVGGRGRIDGDLDPETSSLVASALDSLIAELVRSTPKPDLPVLSELRAEALGEMARRHLDADTTPTDHGNRPHITVVVNWDVLNGSDRGGVSELGDGTVIAPETAQRLACDARVCRLLTGPNAEILDLGRTRRTVSPAQWKALRVRDQHCRFPHCRRPWYWTDAHHILDWLLGGDTDLNNLVLLCRHHHTLVHEGGWRIQGNPDDLIFVRPDGSPLPNGPP